MCQRATGGLFAALAGAPKSDFAWIAGEPGVFASSNLATRAYCRDCGTPLSFSYNLPTARFYVTIGSLDDPNSVPIGHPVRNREQDQLGQILRRRAKRGNRVRSEDAGLLCSDDEQPGLSLRSGRARATGSAHRSAN